MDKILDGLNEEQLEAVTFKHGPLLIIAGAGTGKTTVITRRIGWILSQGLAKTDEILALTFTDKAASEMIERVDVLVPYGYTDIWISTFHAFGDKILRDNALIVGLDPDFKVLTKPEAVVFFREHLFEFNLSYFRPLSDPTRFLDALISLFNRCRDEDISPKEYLDYSQKLSISSKENPDDEALKEEAMQQRELAEAYAKYMELLAKNGLVDFANQFYLALNLLREHPLILKKYQEQFKYILVDEFQDTNFAQYKLVKLITGKAQNITVTGDDDQSIYRFRGAAYSNLFNFIKDFPEARKISIIKNYRSNQEILDSAYRLIQNNNPERFEVKANINKRLIGISQKGSMTAHLYFDANSTEADHVSKLIKEKVSTGNFKYQDFAILVRSNSDAQNFLQSLNMQDIPWQFSGSQGLYSRQEVKLCISFLRVVANFSDSLSLYYLASSDVYRIKLEDLSLCMHYAKRKNFSLHSVFRNIDSITELSQVKDEARGKINNMLLDLDKFLKVSREETTGRLLYSFLSETGYLKELTKVLNLENESAIENIAKFFNLVRDFGLAAREDRVINFVNYLDLLIEAGDDPQTIELTQDFDAVNVLTIHKAKGLEFRVVFLVSLVEGKFPCTHRKQPIELPEAMIKEMLPVGDFHVQEERRLFYVGMTRAKEELYLTSAADYGGKRVRKLSKFVTEAIQGVVKDKEIVKTSALEKIERFVKPPERKSAVTHKTTEAQTLSLSYYQIDDYLTCPLKYKYVHILRVPIMEHHAVIYGRAMHDAVTRYFQFKLAGKKMDLAGLLQVFKETFDPQGFLDIKHQEERFRVGCSALSRFFKEEEKKNIHPLFIEKDFTFLLGANRIIGRFDRVDKEGEGVVIIDFKTSEISKQKDADKRAKENMQLVLYALAYKSIFGVFPERVELHFLESGLVGAKTIDDNELDKITEKIDKVSSGIRSHNFKATPNYMDCEYCAYKQICPDSAAT